MPDTDDPCRAAVAAMLGHDGFSLTALRRGGNSRVFLVRGPDGPMVAKETFRRPGEKRDRQDAEWRALSFLADHGLSRVPRPLVRDRGAGVSLFSFLPGRPALELPPDAGMIDQLTDFLALLHGLRNAEDAVLLGAAAEACLTPAAAETAVQKRLSRLRAVAVDDGQTEALRLFLAEEFSPAAQAITTSCRLEAHRRQLPWDEVPAREKQTLSPSDCGFHNALVAEDGRLFFVDFEYFGWDDPAKMCADFLLHPAMRLGAPLKARFVAAMGRVFGTESRIGGLRIQYPLQGLKWCLLLLNEFLPMDGPRRLFVDGNPPDIDPRAGQLAASRELLCRLRQQPFPSFFPPARTTSHG